MIEIIKELNIEVSKPNVFQAVVAKQYDMNTRFIKATFVDGADKIFIDPEATVTVVINALRPDGESKGFDGVVNEDGTVTVPLHSWMLELDGTVICDISVIDTEVDDNKKLTTTSFTLIVEKAAYGGGDITSDPQYDVLVQLLETCQEASTVAQEALDKSNEANSKYDACVEATKRANQAADDASAVREEVEAGGYIESLKEMNSGKKFTFWVGTKEEFKEVTRIENCLYIFTDAPDVVESEEHHGCYYRTVDGENEWINPPMIEGEVYRTSERCAGKPVYTKKLIVNMPGDGETASVPFIPREEGDRIFICEISGSVYGSDVNNVDYFAPLSAISIEFRDEYPQDYESDFTAKISTDNSVYSQGIAEITVKYTK